MEKISTIKKNIFQFIEYKGITKEEFYEKTEISSSNFKGTNRQSEIGGDKIIKILTIYPEINAEWLLTGKGEMLKENIPILQKNKGKKSNQNNINGQVSGDISILQNELSDFIEIQKSMNEIIKTTQNQLTESQKQVNTLLEILKNK